MTAPCSSCSKWSLCDIRRYLKEFERLVSRAYRGDVEFAVYRCSFYSGECGDDKA